MPICNNTEIQRSVLREAITRYLRENQNTFPADVRGLNTPLMNADRVNNQRINRRKSAGRTNRFPADVRGLNTPLMGADRVNNLRQPANQSAKVCGKNQNTFPADGRRLKYSADYRE